MSDIVERLRAPLGVMQCGERDMPDGSRQRFWLVALDAADTITALRSENERLKAALRQIAGIDPWNDAEQGYVDKARAALSKPAKENTNE